ncbi:MAG: hypothetical protein LW712_00405 [Burkholderiaceae bacterium]|nr:hypothetical protein [Burkholderiaceae bacterium]
MRRNLSCATGAADKTAKIGCTAETLRRRLRQRERDTGQREGLAAMAHIAICNAVCKQTINLAQKFHEQQVGSLVPWRVVIGI